MSIYVNIGNRVRNRRRAKGWNNSTLAKKAGITATTLSKIENSAKPAVKLSTLFRVAEALDTTLADLMGTTKARLLNSTERQRVRDAAQIEMNRRAIAKLKHK